MMKKLSVALLFFLLTACGAGGQTADDLALIIRGGYLASPIISAHCQLTADYGVRVYDFGYDIVSTAEKTSITLTHPAELAGVTAELDGKEGTLHYDGISVQLGELSPTGLSPLMGAGLMLRAVTEDYIASTALDEGALALRCRKDDGEMGTGQEVLLWLDGTTGDLLRGELLVDGVRRLDCTFSNLSWGGLPQSKGDNDGNDNNENVGGD